MKPILNVSEIELDGHFAHGNFEQRYGEIASKIGARKLGYNFTVVPPGKKSGPFHNHRNNEEMFFIVAGSGTLRFGEESYAVRKGDIVACPPGGPEVAHQFINTGNEDLSYLALSTQDPVEIAEFPDSGKFMSYIGHGPDKDFRQIAKQDQGVDYFEGEE